MRGSVSCYATRGEGPSCIIFNIHRQFAGNQLVRFKSDSRFQWVNMAPGGERVELCDTADKVRVWFQGDHAQFPSELDGTSLKTLVIIVNNPAAIVH